MSRPNEVERTRSPQILPHFSCEPVPGDVPVADVDDVGDVVVLDPDAGDIRGPQDRAPFQPLPSEIGSAKGALPGERLDEPVVDIGHGEDRGAHAARRDQPGYGLEAPGALGSARKVDRKCKRRRR